MLKATADEAIKVLRRGIASRIFFNEAIVSYECPWWSSNEWRMLKSRTLLLSTASKVTTEKVEVKARTKLSCFIFGSRRRLNTPKCSTCRRFQEPSHKGCPEEIQTAGASLSLATGHLRLSPPLIFFAKNARKTISSRRRCHADFCPLGRYVIPSPQVHQRRMGIE